MEICEHVWYSEVEDWDDAGYRHEVYLLVACSVCGEETQHMVVIH